MRTPTPQQIAALLAAVVDRKEAAQDPDPEADLELDLVEFARELAELHERDPAAARERAKRFLDGGG